jgi:hypothetical protein
MLVLSACARLADAPNATHRSDASPRFEDFPIESVFTGAPANVNLASHPDGKTLATRLTEVNPYDTRFAGHYRIVEIGCGTACQSIWAVDLVDGSIYSLFTASSGVAYRADSRLIVMNDPEFFAAMLDTSTVAEVENYKETYGDSEFWVEQGGVFTRIGDSSSSAASGPR